MNAYSALYVNDAKKHLGTLFDYAINTCGFDADFFFALFAQSQVTRQFEDGNPSVLAGISGYEMAQLIADEAYGKKELPVPVYYEDKSAEYWAGWAIAHYQWHSGKRFSYLAERCQFSEIIRMYHVYHEMDISSFIERLDALCEERKGETRLKKIRENCGLSQSELAVRSGIHIRNIQMYEQRQNDINKAQARTLQSLSRVLGCSMEDLLE